MRCAEPTRRAALRALFATGAAALLAGPVAAARRWRIAAVTYRGRTAVEDGFEAYFAARGMDVEITWFDLARDLSRLPAIVSAIRTLHPDLLYTWGTTVSLGVLGPYDGVDPARHVTGIPAVFTLVADPVGARLVPSMASPGRDLTGVSHMAPVAAQIRAMMAYRPFRRVGVVYSPTERNSRLVVAQLREQASAGGFALLEEAFPVDAAGRPDGARSMDTLTALEAAGADWLYLPPDSYLTTIAERLIGEAVELGLPAFASTEALIKAGALTGVVSRYESVGQFTAHKAELILRDGRAAATIPAETLSRFSLQVNLPVARRMGLPPPLAMFDYAELIEGEEGMRR